MIPEDQRTFIQPGNPTCQHWVIDDETARCTECDEHMISVRQQAITVQSAPNLAVCTNPDCSGDMDDPNCNAPGVYVPDMSRVKTKVIGYEITYECSRCSSSDIDILMCDGEVTYSCGGSHEGRMKVAR